MTPLRLLPALVLAVLAACGRTPSPPETRRDAPPVEGLLATVNGIAITRADVQRERRGGGGHPGVVPEGERDLLEGVVRQELAAQRAAELALDPGPEYRAEVARVEAMLASLKRRKLAEAFDRHVDATATVGDEEARAYFEAERARIRTELRVFQLMLHDRARIEQARRDLEAGASFEEVARREFPALPASAGAFWDLGWLRFSQVPPQWRAALEALEPGQTSGIIEGPKSRHWIVKLVERRENPAVEFEAVKPMIVETLRAAKVDSARAEAERELRSRARVVYAEGASAQR